MTFLQVAETTLRAIVGLNTGIGGAMFDAKLLGTVRASGSRMLDGECMPRFLHNIQALWS